MLLRLPKAFPGGSRRWVSTSFKPWYITTPIFYPNAGQYEFVAFWPSKTHLYSSVPHIGHLYSLVIADIFARYNALKNPLKPVYFVTGTDEHGLKIQKAALDKELPPKEFCDSISQQFRVCFRFDVWLILVLMEYFRDWLLKQTLSPLDSSGPARKHIMLPSNTFG